MPLTREAAWELLCDWTPSEALRRHARAVEIVMRAAAARYGGDDADIEEWGQAGMLHDADYEAYPEQHPNVIVKQLRESGNEAIAHAISAHYTKWGVSYDSLLDKALLACDELTGFIVACAQIRPDGIASLEPKSVVKKLKDKGFAAKVDREEVYKGVELFGVDLSEHIGFIIGVLRENRSELGI